MGQHDIARRSFGNIHQTQDSTIIQQNTAARSCYKMPRAYNLLSPW
jgi:hypothetical protein